MAKKTHEELANIFSKRFEDYNTRVLKDIAETIKQFNGLKYTEAHKLAQQLKYNKSYKKVVDELSKLSNKSKKEVSGILEETAKQDIEFNEVYFKARNLDVPIYESDKTLKGIVDSVARVSGDDFVNISKNSGFVFLDQDKHFRFLNMEKTYQRVIDECVYAVQTGQDTFNNVMRKTINQLADSGVRYITYANEGKKAYTQRIEVAVRRNIMDSIRAINIETNRELGKRFRYDGMEITVHPYPAPDHEKVQGHQFTKKEFDKFQNDSDCKDINGVEYPAVSDETGRDRRSIGQYNCYHTADPIVIGITRPRYTQEELQKIIDDNHKGIEVDGKHYTLYEATQLQRNIEAEIRKSKDAHIMSKTTDDRLGMLKEQKRITQLTTKYKEITKKANIPDQLKQRSTVSGSTVKVKYYKDVTKEWLKNKKDGNYKVIDRKYFIDKNNNKYNVDNKNIVYNYTKDEKETAEWLSKTFGDNVYMNPVILKPENIKTADYYWRNELWDKKSLKNVISTTRAFDNAIKSSKEQSNNFIIDLTGCKLDNNIIIKQVQNSFNPDNKLYRNWLDKVIIKRNKELIKIIIKNR